MYGRRRKLWGWGEEIEQRPEPFAEALRAVDPQEILDPGALVDP
jgi:hypothetical protein